MSDPFDEVLAALRAKRNEHDAEISKIDAAIAAIQIVRPIGGVPERAEPAIPAVLDGRFSGKSLSVAAKTVLAEADRPMHVNEIVAAIEQNGLTIASADKPNNVGAVLTGRMKRKADVLRVGRGTWQIVPDDQEYRKEREDFLSDLETAAAS